jgi:hypothetical protein
MDEDFDYFLEKFGPAIDRREVPQTSLDRFRGKLPDQLLAYWEEYGWCGYAEGLFWTVDPQEYDPVLSAWLGQTRLMEEDAYHLVARSAFGDLYFFGERLGGKLHVIAADSTMMEPRPGTTNRDLRIRAFFGSLSQAACDFSDINGVRLFAPALAKLGRLKHDEMYGFVPALALGGPATLDHLQKVKAVEHLVLLAQLSELRVMKTP